MSLFDDGPVVAFNIPAQPDDLLECTEGFAVSLCSEPSEISQHNQLEMIDEAAQLLDNPLAICDNACFDVLFSFARNAKAMSAVSDPQDPHLHVYVCVSLHLSSSFETLEAPVRAKLFASLLKGTSLADYLVEEMFACSMQSLGRALKTELPDLTAASGPARRAIAATEMISYLFGLIAVTAEREEAQANRQTLQTAGKKTKKALPAVAQGEFSWAHARSQAYGVVAQLLELELPKLWSMSCPDEAFVNLFTRVLYLALENPEVVKDKDLRQDIFEMLGRLVQAYNHTLGACTTIVHMLPHFEHLSEPFADLVTLCSTKYNSPRVTQDVLHELSHIDGSDFGNDNSAARAYAVFLVAVGQQQPGICVQAVHQLAELLENEAYSLRNAVLSMLSAILSQHLKSLQDEESVKTRTQLLNMLVERINDVSAYTRKAALSALTDLAMARAIPLQHIQAATDAAILRIEDKSSLVRKQALHLAVELMRQNPFGAKLCAQDFRNALAEAKSKLEHLCGVTSSSSGEQKPSIKTEPTASDTTTSANTDEGADELAEMSTISSAQDETTSEADGLDLVVETQEQREQLVVVDFLRRAVAMTEALSPALRVAAQLLGSKTNSDVLEAITFFVTAVQFGVDDADRMAHKMLVLIWSKENGVKQAVLDAYRTLYFTPDPAIHNTAKARSCFVVDNLIRMTSVADIGDGKCLEELVQTMMKEGVLTDSVVKQLWDTYARAPEASQDAERLDQHTRARFAMAILSMAARADGKIIRDNTGLLMSVGFPDQSPPDCLLARETAVGLRQLLPRQSEKGSMLAPQRLARDHMVFVTMLTFVQRQFTAKSEGWIPTAEAVLDTVYALGEQPDHLAGSLLAGLAARMTQPADCSPTERLKRLLFLVGHVALRQLVHTEDVQSEMKRRRAAQDDLQQQARGKKKTSDEEDMGVGGASADDAEAEFIHQVCESELLSTQAQLGSFCQLVVNVCTAPERFASAELQAVAVTTLSKLMTVSSQFCDDNLQLLFSVAKHSAYPIVRSNAMVALGDLAFRFPNLIEPWTAQLYSPLRDSSARVRKNTVMVLTHLILNDMIKIKGQISELALCLCDPIERIGSLTRLFFTELANKGNAIYNILPDVISHISSPDASVDAAAFETIASFLFQFIKKDKQAESLVEKLCHRFRTTQSVVQWRQFAYCLTLIDFSDKCVRKLTENFACFHDKLGDASIYGSFQEVIARANKFAKPEMKDAIAELEQRIGSCHEKGAEDEAALQEAAKASKRVRRGRKTASTNDKSMLEDGADENASDAVRNRRSTRGTAKPKAQPSRPRRRRAICSDDEDDSDEDFLAEQSSLSAKKLAPRMDGLSDEEEDLLLAI
ncbi:uncharacterized protein MONBRDRAFT_33420 [Monosiga brevicollis MX1]|uniref:Condensin complex subunit 1 n=1 Tax=Monosiga brevicollis TaxID=81824 RepID=A9V5A8_MONBE|nr:uncharacterized protein MONBRDRAFT_33420 [Monosiga brevicollis MX1]EDQ87343.1 predicted protein [Monosiga brevicollis MX1]|eukprot:XP_001747956.1 hypothetical protein [Monosiga brevicollis MX1]